jgi:hypothetical protein
MPHLTSVEIAAKGRRIRSFNVSYHFRCEVREIADEGVDVVLHDLTGRSRPLAARLRPNNFTESQLDSMLPGDIFEWRLGEAQLNTGSSCHYSETVFP